jgi:hypothetical protein
MRRRFARVPIARLTAVLVAAALALSACTAPESPADPSLLASVHPSPETAVGKAVSLYDFIEFWGDNRAGMEADFGELAAAGVTWARLRLAASPTAEDRFATVVTLARQYGIQLVVIVEKPPPRLDLGSENDQRAYRSWLAQVVRRFKDSVHFWEILSEPNLRYTWNIDSAHGSDQGAYVASVRRYVALLREGYRVVKAADPTATVLFGGLSEAKVERYLRVLVTTDAHRFFDVMDFHAYGRTPEEVLSRYQSFRRNLRGHPSYASKPIWLEFGFNTSWSNRAGYSSSEKEKARRLVRATELLSAAGAQGPVFWFTLHGNNADNPGFGLITRDRQDLSRVRLSAWYALKDLPAPLASGAPAAPTERVQGLPGR